MSKLITMLAKVLIVPIALVLPLTACSSEGVSLAQGTSAVSTTGSTQAGTNVDLAAKKYKMATVKKHHTRSSCWSVVGKNVYNLTKWISKHPGGSKRILSMCGKNATKAFRGQHGTGGRANKILATYKIGVLA